MAYNKFTAPESIAEISKQKLLPFYFHGTWRIGSQSTGSAKAMNLTELVNDACKGNGNWWACWQN